MRRSSIFGPSLGARAESARGPRGQGVKERCSAQRYPPLAHTWRVAGCPQCRHEKKLVMKEKQKLFRFSVGSKGSSEQGSRSPANRMQSRGERVAAVLHGQRPPWTVSVERCSIFSLAQHGSDMIPNSGRFGTALASPQDVFDQRGCEAILDPTSRRKHQRKYSPVEMYTMTRARLLGALIAPSQRPQDFKPRACEEVGRRNTSDLQAKRAGLFGR